MTHPNLQNSYPIQLLIKGRRALVVGAGNIAHRKIQGLLAAGAEVTVVGPEVNPKVAALPVDIVERPYREREVGDYQLVITCTDDPLVNRQVFRDAEAAGVWVNSADDPVNCSFILPSVARRGDLTITASTNGKSPALSMWLRRRFEAEFDERYDKLMDLLVEVRAEARYVLGTSEVAGWNEALDDGVFELVAAGETDAAREILRTALGLVAATQAQAGYSPAAESPKPTPQSTNELDKMLRANESAIVEPKVTANGSATLEPTNEPRLANAPEQMLRANGSITLEPTNESATV